MDWDVTTQGTEPVAYANFVTREDIDRMFKRAEEKRRRELRKMKKSELIEYIISIGK